MSAFEDLLEEKRKLSTDLLAIENDLTYANERGWKRERAELIAKKHAATNKLREVKHKLAVVNVRSQAELRGDSYDPDDPASMLAALRDEVLENYRYGNRQPDAELQQLLDDARDYVQSAHAARIKREEILKRANVVTR